MVGVNASLSNLLLRHSDTALCLLLDWHNVLRLNSVHRCRIRAVLSGALRSDGNIGLLCPSIYLLGVDGESNDHLAAIWG